MASRFRGRRFSIGLSALAVTIAGVIVPLAVSVTPAGAATSSSKYGPEADAYQIDPLHDGHSVDTGLTTPLTKRWSVDLGGTVSYPLVEHGRVFVTVGTTNGASLVALSASTGGTLWGPIPRAERH